MTSSEIYREADCVMMQEIRDVTPVHYVLKIKSFSLFAKNNMKYESNEFSEGGYKWKLILYPNGDKSRNGEGHISLYLVVSRMSPFQIGRGIHVTVRFSLHDQICDRYLTEQGRVTRLHGLKDEWGVPRYMPLKTFTDPSNGYLVDDTCVFGVEVFIIRGLGDGECVTQKESTSFTQQWVVWLRDTYIYTDAFTVGAYKWKVWVCPRGDLDNRGLYLSAFLCLDEADELDPGQKVNARFVIRLKGQNNVVHHEPEACTIWFSSSIRYGGWPCFMPLKTVQECVKNDSCVLEAEITVLGTASKLP